MIRVHRIQLLSFSVLFASQLAATEIEVVFEGEVTRSLLPGIARGQPVSGRLVYDNTAVGAPVPEAGVVTYGAVRLFEVKAGCAEYVLTDAPGELVLFALDPSSPLPIGMVCNTSPGGILGPAQGGFIPMSFGLQLVPQAPSFFPSNALSSIPLEYSLSDFADEPLAEDMGIQFVSAGGGDTETVLVLFSKLEARPLIPTARTPVHFIQLEDIVAGGDGSGTAPPGNTGIDPRTGAFTTGYFDGRIFETDGVNPQPVPASPFIDSVFLLKGKVPTAVDGCNGCFVQYTTQSGVQLWLSDAEETGRGWNYIIKKRTETEGFCGRNSATGIGLNPSAGITFDLDELRARHGDAAVGCFSAADWGKDITCDFGLVRLMAMVSNDAQGVIDIRQAVFDSFSSRGQLSMPIPRTAQYLTLASASVDGNDNGDYAIFVRPIITPDPCPPHTTGGWIWRITPSRVAPGGEPVIVEGEGLSLIDDFFGFRYSIRVGGVDLLQLTHLSQQYTSGVTPSLAPGFYDVELVWRGFQEEVHQRLPGAIEVAPPPTITAVSPVNVLADRRTLARFQGQNLRPDMVVLVFPSIESEGGEALVRQEYHRPELIVGLVPPPPPIGGLAGTDVFILDQGRTRGTSVSLLYLEGGIGNVAPNQVLTTGGSVVTICGLRFEPGMTFRLGSIPLLDVEIIDSGHARGRTPPLAAGVLHSAELFHPDGQLLYTLPNAVEALPPPSPSIGAVAPLAVSTRGGDLLTVYTDTWHGGATPRVGGFALSNVDATLPNLLRGEAPQLAPGFHDVDLVGADGAVLSRLEAAVKAIAPVGIRITGVSPFEVAVNGGTPVTFIGTGFEPGLEPRLGGLPLTQVELVDGVDGQQLRGLSPPLAEGLHFASLTEGDVERARFEDAVHVLPIHVPSPIVLGRPPAWRFAAGTDRIGIAATGVPSGAVLRVGGMPVVAVAPSSPGGGIGGEGGGAGITGDGGHAVFEGLVPALPPGRYAVDFYLPGQGVLATLDDAVEVVGENAAPQASHVVSADVLADGSTRLHIFGSCFAPATRFVLGGKPIADAVVVSSRLAIGHAPALGSGEELGPRTLEVIDSRGTSSLRSAVIYVEPKTPPGVAFIRGDANQSGKVDISDAVTILGYLFLGNPQRLECLESGDIDEGGAVDIADPIQLLGHLFLGGPAPRSPFPACGEAATALKLGCDGFEACGSGGATARGQGGGLVGGLRPNVFVLPETRTTPGEPILRDVSPVSHEVVIDDPPGGLDLEPGDIVSGFVPVTSAAIHEGITFLTKLEGERPRSCLATAATDRTYLAQPAALAEVFNDAVIDFEMPGSAPDLRLSSDLVMHTGNTLCDIAEQAGAAGGGQDDPAEQGGGGVFAPLIDVDLPPMELTTWNDGPNYVHAGFHRLRVLYANDEASLGVGISGLKVTGVSFFSGILLDTEMILYVDAHYEEHMNREKKVLSLRKDHIVVVYGIPIHFAATGDLIAGVDLDAEVNLHAVAGAKAHFKAGVGIRYDGSRIENLSGIDPPTLAEIPDATELNLNGALVVKGYVRPETHLFAGILFRGLTADIGMRGEAFARFHAAGTTQPVPCFDWGIDAGMQLTLVPEIQFFGKDLFDRTIGLFNEEELDLVGSQVGCKTPPVPRVSYYVVRLPGDRYEVHLDASASYDPDDGQDRQPLRFRWDFDADGQCDRATLGDPRTMVVLENACLPLAIELFGSNLCRRSMRLRVTDNEDVAADYDFRVVLR
ncbi:MAG: hypothetical protein HY721_34475 [Planctomycetes bacterium]|nr:hypothetical protein [Planctomycetota bacterium]